MFKVVLWDYADYSAQWVENFLQKDNVKIIRTLRPNDNDQAEVILRGDWNFVLIFEENTREIFEEMLNTMRAMNFSTENIIFAHDLYSWLNNPAAAYSLINPATGGGIFTNLNFNYTRQLNNFVTCTVEGLSYVATSKDNCIMRDMYVRHVNWSAHDMKRFHALAKKYYNLDDTSGYFLDLGANIGTTGIYFTKKLAPNLKLLAFEPDPENFKLLRTNLILNDMDDDKATAVNCGLGDKFDELTMYRDLKNPGHNSFTDPKDNVPTETIKIMPLDAYFAENNIAAREVKYIWIDTEGFEPQVLLGAKNLLTENLAPIFMEFTPKIWNKSGYFERFVDLLKTVGYTHYIWTHELGQTNTEQIHSIEELWNFQNSTADFGMLGDIFLIRNDSAIN